MNFVKRMLLAILLAAAVSAPLAITASQASHRAGDDGQCHNAGGCAD